MEHLSFEGFGAYLVFGFLFAIALLNFLIIVLNILTIADYRIPQNQLMGMLTLSLPMILVVLDTSLEILEPADWDRISIWVGPVSLLLGIGFYFGIPMNSKSKSKYYRNGAP